MGMWRIMHWDLLVFSFTHCYFALSAFLVFHNTEAIILQRIFMVVKLFGIIWEEIWGSWLLHGCHTHLKPCPTIHHWKMPTSAGTTFGGAGFPLVTLQPANLVSSLLICLVFHGMCRVFILSFIQFSSLMGQLIHCYIIQEYKLQLAMTQVCNLDFHYQIGIYIWICYAQGVSTPQTDTRPVFPYWLSYSQFFFLLLNPAMYSKYVNYNYYICVNN